MTGALVCARSIVQLYARDDRRVVALDGLDLDIAPSEFVTITGSSGSGKSTLLRLLAGLEPPTAGSIQVEGRELAEFDAAARERYRREVVGVVQQQAADNLLPYLDAVSNVEFPMTLTGVGRRERRRAAMALLELLGVADRARHRPAAMSGGQQQRVAIAVALANRPAMVLADEPTGELDATSTTDVVDAFHLAAAELGSAVVAVTHDPLVAARTARTVEIRHGRVETEIRRDLAGGGTARRFHAVDARGALQLDDELLDRLPASRLIEVDVDRDVGAGQVDRLPERGRIVIDGDSGSNG